MQLRMTLAFLAATAYCWLMLSVFLSTETPRSFFAELPSSWLTSSLYWCLGLFLPRGRTWYFALLKFTKFLLVYFSIPLRSFCMAAQPSGVSAAPPNFVLSATLLRVHLFPWCRLLMKLFEQYWLQYWALGYTAGDWPPARLHAALLASCPLSTAV